MLWARTMQVHAELNLLRATPRELVLMDRAALGLGSVFMHLKAEVNWHRLFEGLIDDFDVETLRSRQKEAAQLAGLPDHLWQHENTEDAEFEG